MRESPPDKTDPSEAAPVATASTPQAPPGKKRRTRLSDRVRGARSSIDVKKQALLERAAKERESRESVRALFRLYEEDKGRGGGLLAGGLAYRVFIWMLPTALVASSLVRLLADATGESPSAAARDLGMGAAVASSVNRAAAQAGQAAPILLVVGLVIMLWASRGVLKALRLVSAIAWGLNPEPLRSPVRPTLATAGFLLVLPLYGIAVDLLLFEGSLASDLVATLLAIAGLAAIVTWAAGALPRPDGVGGFDLLPGALLFAVGMGGLRLATMLYFAEKLDRIDDVYGALGFAAVFMTYLYLVARLVVLALMANAAVWRSGLFRRSIDAE